MSVEVIVDDRLRVDARSLTEAELKALKEEFEHKNPERAKLKAMGVPHWDEPEYYRTWKGGPGTITLPRGGTVRLRELLGKRLVFRDRRTFPPCDQAAHRFTLRPYQEDAVDAILQWENCVVRSPTGSGKTVMAIGAASRIQSPSLIVVWNSALLKQWRADLALQLGIRERDVGHIQGKKVRLAPVTVAMQQTLWKLDAGAREHVRSYFGALFMDEVHRAAARTFMDVIDWIPARYRVGLTADERRKDRKEFLIYDHFGKVAFEIERAALEEDGSIVEVEVRVVLTGLEAEWFKTEDRQAHARLLEQITWDDERTALAAKLVEQCVKAGHQTLAFSHRREHCQRIRAAVAQRGIPCGLMLGGPEDVEELDRAIRGMRDGTMKAAVGTVQAVGTGIDLPTVARGVVATPMATNKQLWGQLRGRFCRPAEGKGDAVIYYLHDQSPLGETPVRMLSRWNRRCVVIDEAGHDVPAKEWIARQHGTTDRMLAGLGAALADRSTR